MPSYHHYQHPLTPPDYISPFGPTNYGVKPATYGFEPVYDQLSGKMQQVYMNHQFSREQGQYVNAAQPAGPYTGMPPPGLTHPGALSYQHPSQFSLPPPQAMHITDERAKMEMARTQQKAQETAQEESRPVGGVAAKLDYEMEEMVDFVAHMTTGIVEKYSHNTPVTPAFRKFVLQMLSSTRLPKATILLGMEYLSTRSSTEGAAVSNQRNQAYRMLTMALLLASKFLDDNTFQNRSWAEVTGIPGLELNQMEIEWLTGMDWRLHVDADAPKGFYRWKSVWDNWSSKNKRATYEHQGLPLPPINTHMSMPAIKTSFSPQPLYPPHNLQAVGYATTGMTDGSNGIDQSSAYWWPTPGLATPGGNSSPAGPDTGPTTPDQFGRMCWQSAFGPQASRPRHVPPPHLGHFQAHSQPTILQSQNPYAHHVSPHQHGWQLGVPCSCGACTRAQNESFFLNSFGPRGQVVVG